MFYKQYTIPPVLSGFILNVSQLDIVFKILNVKGIFLLINEIISLPREPQEKTDGKNWYLTITFEPSKMSLYKNNFEVKV